MALVFRMHGTARDVTRVMIAFLAPTVLLGPAAGVWADRWNPRRTMIASDAVRAALILLLAFAASRWQIYAVCFLVSSVSCFFAPAQSITVPVLVRRGGLIAASGLMQQTMQAIRILSPAAASALAGWLGERACYYGDSLTFVFSAVMLSALNDFRSDRTAAAKTTGAISTEWREGMRYILDHPKLSFVIFSMTAGTFATGCFGALLSVFIRDVLHAGRSVFGITGSLIGAGSVAGAVVMTRLARGVGSSRSGSGAAGGRFASPYMVSLGMAGTGTFVLALAASRTVASTFACAAGIGFSVAVLMVAATALLQGETPTGIRGRVSSTSLAFTSAAQAASLILWAERRLVSAWSLCFARVARGCWHVRSAGHSCGGWSRNKRISSENVDAPLRTKVTAPSAGEAALSARRSGLRKPRPDCPPWDRVGSTLRGRAKQSKLVRHG